MSLYLSTYVIKKILNRIKVTAIFIGIVVKKLLSSFIIEEKYRLNNIY